MLLELNDVMRIIAANYETMGRSLDQAAEDENEKTIGRKVLKLMGSLCSAISRDIEKAENERVCSMLEGMEKYEFKTDDEEGSE